MKDISNLAVIVLNYKNYELTIKCVKRVLFYKLNCKIVVVDNNSNNHSYEIMKKNFFDYENVFVIRTKKNGGYSYGNNFGIKFILNKVPTIDYICIMNPDVYLDYGDLFYNLINKIKCRKDIAGITSISIINNRFDYRTIGWKLPNVISIINSNLTILSKVININFYKCLNLDNRDKSLGYIDVMPGSFFIIKKEIFEQISFFDDNVFLYYEENILASKIKKLKYKFVISINDYYLHNHNNKDKKLMKLKYTINDFKNIIKSQRYYVKKYLGKGYLIWSVIALSCYIHLYIEIPINNFLKKCIKR